MTFGSTSPARMDPDWSMQRIACVVDMVMGSASSTRAFFTFVTGGASIKELLFSLLTDEGAGRLFCVNERAADDDDDDTVDDEDDDWR